jgi:hypothetical protein
VEWINLAQDRGRWRSVVDTVYCVIFMHVITYTQRDGYSYYQKSPSCNFVHPQTNKYLPHYPNLERPQPTAFLQHDWLSNPYEAGRKITVVCIPHFTFQTAEALPFLKRQMWLLWVKIRQSGIYRHRIGHFTMGHLAIRRSLQNKNTASWWGYLPQRLTQNKCTNRSTNFI